MKAPGPEQLNAEAIPDDSKASRGYLFAAAAILIAFLIRLSLDSFLKDKFPNATIVLATVLVAWYGGVFSSPFFPPLGVFFFSWVFFFSRGRLLLNTPCFHHPVSIKLS